MTKAPRGVGSRRHATASPGSLVAIGLTLIALAFLVLGTTYAAMPPDIVVLRNLAGDAIVRAAKSPVIVFRVAVIGLVTALAAAVMLRRAHVVADVERRTAYVAMFSILLVAAGLKAAFEALELAASTGADLQAYVRVFRFGTFASALLGTGLALLRGWPVLAAVHRSDWQLARRDRVALGILLVVYLAAAVWPLLGPQGKT